MGEILDSRKDAFDIGIIKPGRSVGNTTRQIDLIIQRLFEGERILVLDHNNGENGFNAETLRRTSSQLFDRLLRRLFREHPTQMKDHVKYDKAKLTIEFI